MRDAATWLIGLGLALGLAGSAGAAEIPPGTYHCKAGGSRMMLTLGDMTVSGHDYTFTDPTGGASSGHYESDGDGFLFEDIGAITADQIVESGLDATPGAFYFTYRARPGSLPTTASCSLM